MAGPLLQLAVHQLAADSATPQAVGFPALLILVAVGSVVPVIPTAALVSASAVAAFHSSWAALDVPLVWLAGALGAWLGDLALYALAGRAGNRWTDRIRDSLHGPRARSAQQRLAAHGPGFLVLARLIPAGRVSAMAACLLSDWSPRRFAVANVPAAAVWSAAYALIGVAGGALFANPWEGIAAAIGFALLLGLAPVAWHKLRKRQRQRQPASD